MRDIAHHFGIVSMEKPDLADVVSMQYLHIGNHIYYQIESCLYSVEEAEASMI